MLSRLANALSYTRIAIGGVNLLIGWFNHNQTNLTGACSWMLGFSVLALATDWLDGPAARKFGGGNPTLDPNCDLAFCAGTAVGVVLLGLFPLWLLLVILGLGQIGQALIERVKGAFRRFIGLAIPFGYIALVTAMTYLLAEQAGIFHVQFGLTAAGILLLLAWFKRGRWLSWVRD